VQVGVSRRKRYIKEKPSGFSLRSAGYQWLARRSTPIASSILAIIGWWSPE
jgi:hypothetical protein